MSRFLLSILISLATTALLAQDHRFDPPWNTPPESKVQFTVYGIDNVPDLYGDINDPELVVFFAGNQFMCIDALLESFKKVYPKYQRVFAETLPPGILARQIDGGSLTVGNMRITLQPDVYTAGQSKIAQMKDLFTDTVVYARNQLAILVSKGNPKNITGLKSLGRPDIRVSMPNPDWEDVGKLIEQAYVKAGGEALKNRIMDEKVKDSSTYLTQIHHRQSPMRILYQQSDAAPVWYSEALYQQQLNRPVDVIPIPAGENVTATYIAAELKKAPHPEAARDFMQFLKSEQARDIYKRFGFTER